MRYDNLVVAAFWVLLVGCGSERSPSTSDRAAKQASQTVPSSSPLPGENDVPLAPSKQPAATAASVTRHVSSFHDAVTEVPPWNDTNPPFDLAGFLKAPPVGDNAAPLYLAALVKFDDWGELSSDDISEEEYRRQHAPLKKRRDEQQRLDDAWEKDPKSVDMSAVDAWLENFDVGFQMLVEAQRRPQCAFQTGLRIDTLLGYAQIVRQVARIALWRTRSAIERGDIERPIDDLTTVLRLSRDLRPRGPMVCQLVSIAVDNWVCCKQVVPLILNAPGIETRHCDRLLALLIEHEGEVVNLFWEGVRAEYFVNRFFLDDLQHRTGTFDPRHMKEDFDIKGNVQSWVACIHFLDAMGGIGPVGEEKLKALVSGARSSGSEEPERHALLPSAWTGGKVLSDDDYVKHVDALNRVFASILDLADQPELSRQAFDGDTMTRICEPLLETTLGAFIPIPALGAARNASLREEATLRGTQCLIALRRWQLEHTELPEDLGTLVEAAGMPGVPIDPYSGQPLRMAVVWGEPVIYSVGPDGKDDNALLEWIGGRNPGDLIFRLVAPPASVRTWTNNTGKHSVAAELVEVQDGSVVLRKANGKTTTLPLGKLSQTDRDYLESTGNNGEDRP